MKNTTEIDGFRSLDRVEQKISELEQRCKVIMERWKVRVVKISDIENRVI